MPESDVCRRQILAYKDGPARWKNKIFLTPVDPEHNRYSNEAKIASKVIYDDFKSKKNGL